tara:strand:- start:218 stop:859 length:642 start_codon:yes stop_codon:yes gene_type:complete
MCCGKGGDVFKFLHSGISFYTGIDHSNQSIEEAVRRTKHVRGKTQIQFHCYDCSQDLYFLNMQYDCIFCNLAIHYMCETREVLHSLMANVSRLLKKGQHFICTTCDMEKVYYYMKHKNKYFEISKCKSLPQQYKVPYHFKMKDCVNAPEYLVSVGELMKIGEMVGLQIQQCENFEKLFHQFCNTYNNVYQESFQSVDCIKEIDLYNMICFVKI